MFVAKPGAAQRWPDSKMAISCVMQEDNSCLSCLSCYGSSRHSANLQSARSRVLGGLDASCGRRGDINRLGELRLCKLGTVCRTAVSCSTATASLLAIELLYNPTRSLCRLRCVRAALPTPPPCFMSAADGRCKVNARAGPPPKKIPP
jgi:hypothetical protein